MPKNKMHQLVWNSADPESETKPRQIFKANYASLEDALEQARHDVSIGIQVLGIVNLTPKTALHQMTDEQLQEHFVWTPKDDE